MKTISTLPMMALLLTCAGGLSMIPEAKAFPESGSNDIPNNWHQQRHSHENGNNGIQETWHRQFHSPENRNNDTRNHWQEQSHWQSRAFHHNGNQANDNHNNGFQEFNHNHNSNVGADHHNVDNPGEAQHFGTPSSGFHLGGNPGWGRGTHGVFRSPANASVKTNSQYEEGFQYRYQKMLRNNQDSEQSASQDDSQGNVGGIGGIGRIGASHPSDDGSGN